MNPILKELGFDKTDKVVIIHADDVGLNLASIDAYEELMELGTISSGSAMVPSPWFPEVIERYKEKPDWDLGIHLAFNSEYKNYKWRPISTTERASGFVDDNGYFLADKALVQKTAEPEYIKREMKAQIDVAFDLGLVPSHVDTHNGMLWTKKFVRSYASVLREYHVLPVLFNPGKDDLVGSTLIKRCQIDKEYLDYLDTNGFPLVDKISGMPVENTYDVENRYQLAKYMLKNTKPGQLVHFAFHPMKDSRETRALNRYTQGRISDFTVFSKPELKKFMQNEGIHLIGYKDIQKVLNKDIDESKMLLSYTNAF